MACTPFVRKAQWTRRAHVCFLGFVFKAYNFIIAQTEIPRNTHVPKNVSHRSARFAMSWQHFKSIGFLVLGAIDSSLQNWGAFLTKRLGR